MSWIWSPLISGCKIGVLAIGGENWKAQGVGELTWRSPSSKLKTSSMTTSSSFFRISVILFAIHLRARLIRLVRILKESYDSPSVVEKEKALRGRTQIG